MANSLLYLSNLLNTLMILLNIMRKVFLYKLTSYRASTNIRMEWYHLFLLELPVETLVILLNPSPFLLQKRYLSFNAIDYYETKITYLDNDMLQIISLLKVFVLIRAFLTKSVWYSDRAFRVCQIFSFELNYMFVIRCLMFHQPFLISLAWNMIGVLLFAMAIRITEKPLKIATDRMDHSQYLHCIWEAFITMATVGYGDFFPRTGRGRIVMVICAVYGTVGFSLIVVSVTNILQMSTREKRAYMLLKRVDYKKKMKEIATRLVGKAVRYKIAKEEDYDTAEAAIDNMRDTYENLHDVSEQYKELSTMISMEDKALYSFTYILSNLKKLHQDTHDLCLKMGIDPKQAIIDARNANKHKRKM